MFNPEELDNQYASQRKDRMQDSIDDYLNDPKVDARRVYEEMLDGVNDVIEYHKKGLDKAVQLKELMLGHRNIDFDGFDTSLDNISINSTDKIFIQE